MRDPMKYFADHLSDIDGIGIHHQLARHGSAYEVLRRLGAAEFLAWSADDALAVELPCYGKGFGIDRYGFWEEPDTPVLHIHDWIEAIARNKIQLGDSFKYWKDTSRLEKEGPSLAIHDTTFDKILLVDGCHRALMRVKVGWTVPVVVYKSPYAHMLIFPSHFVNHAIIKAEALA